MVVEAVDDQGGASNQRCQPPGLTFVREPGRLLRQDQDLGRRLEAPTNRILELLRGVGLGEHLRHEELDEARIVTEPVMAVVLGPELVGVEDLVEPFEHHALREGSRRGHVRRDEHRSEDAVGVERGQLKGEPSPG